MSEIETENYPENEPGLWETIKTHKEIWLIIGPILAFAVAVGIPAVNSLLSDLTNFRHP